MTRLAGDVAGLAGNVARLATDVAGLATDTVTVGSLLVGDAAMGGNEIEGFGCLSKACCQEQTREKTLNENSNGFHHP